MKNSTRIVLVVALAGLSVPAHAQRRGVGSGRDSTTQPVTRNSSDTELGTARDIPLEPHRGFFGGPGAAPDDLGASRLGPHAERAARPSYGESASSLGGGESYEAWKSGDRVRSTSSGDVRAARQQQAPDLEWASDARPGGRAGEETKVQPQAPFGKRSQEGEQKQPRR